MALLMMLASMSNRWTNGQWALPLVLTNAVLFLFLTIFWVCGGEERGINILRETVNPNTGEAIDHLSSPRGGTCSTSAGAAASAAPPIGASGSPSSYLSPGSTGTTSSYSPPSSPGAVDGTASPVDSSPGDEYDVPAKAGTWSTVEARPAAHGRSQSSPDDGPEKVVASGSGTTGISAATARSSTASSGDHDDRQAPVCRTTTHQDHRTAASPSRSCTDHGAGDGAVPSSEEVFEIFAEADVGSCSQEASGQQEKLEEVLRKVPGPQTDLLRKRKVLSSQETTNRKTTAPPKTPEVFVEEDKTIVQTLEKMIQTLVRLQKDDRGCSLSTVANPNPDRPTGASAPGPFSAKNEEEPAVAPTEPPDARGEPHDHGPDPSSVRAVEVRQGFIFAQWAFQSLSSAGFMVYGAVALKACALSSASKYPGADPSLDPAWIDSALTIAPLLGGAIGTFGVMPFITARVNRKLARRKRKLERFKAERDRRKFLRRVWRKLENLLRGAIVDHAATRRTTAGTTNKPGERGEEFLAGIASASRGSRPEKERHQRPRVAHLDLSSTSGDYIPTTGHGTALLSTTSSTRSARGSVPGPQHAEDQQHGSFDVAATMSSAQVAWDAVCVRAVPQILQFMVTNLFFILLSTDENGQTLSNKLALSLMGAATSASTEGHSGGGGRVLLGGNHSVDGGGGARTSTTSNPHHGLVDGDDEQVARLEMVNAVITMTVLGLNGMASGLQSSLTQPSTQQSVKSQGRFSQLDNACGTLLGPYLVALMTTGAWFSGWPMVGSSASGEQGHMEATLKVTKVVRHVQQSGFRPHYMLVHSAHLHRNIYVSPLGGFVGETNSS